MIIKKPLEYKIRFLCEKNKNNEYSGTLFYRTEGSFEDNNLCIVGVDLYLQDLGSSVYTELSQDISMASYMARHDLMDCYTGCMHSHHNMTTNFSSTDMETVNDWGNTQNHFVSLIVNNAGKYSAKITRKIKKTVNSVASGTIEYSYKSWQDAEHSSTTTFKSKNDSVTDYYIEVFNLDITVEHSDYRKSELEERLDELISLKRNINNQNFSYGYNYSEQGILPFAKREDTPDNRDMAVHNYNPYKGTTVTPYTENDKRDFQDLSEYFPKKYEKIVSDFIKQIITFNLLSPLNSSLNIASWTKNFDKICRKMFPDIKTFIGFIGEFINLVLNYYTVESDEFREWASEMTDDFDPEYPSSGLAYEIFLQKVIQELHKLNIEGDYIKFYYAVLEKI